MIIDNGIVVFTPPESDSLYCYDLLSGELLYSRKRGQACYVAGIDGSNLILVGPQQVLAYDLRRKENRWETRFPDGLALVGKGVWQAGQLLLPLTDQRLIQIELAHGKLVSQATVAQPLGNLFAHRGHLLSIGPTSITAYYTRSQLEQQVQERLAQNPQDTWGLNYRSQLLLAEGQVMAALQLLLEAYAANPHDDDTRYFLADAMLAGLQSDFERFAGYTDQLDDVVQSSRACAICSCWAAAKSARATTWARSGGYGRSCRNSKPPSWPERRAGRARCRCRRGMPSIWMPGSPLKWAAAIPAVRTISGKRSSN